MSVDDDGAIAASFAGTIETDEDIRLTTRLGRYGDDGTDGERVGGEYAADGGRHGDVIRVNKTIIGHDQLCPGHQGRHQYDTC